MSITAGLTETKAGLDVAKLLMDKLNNPNVDMLEVRSIVQELLIHLVNAQVALGEAQMEINELRSCLDERKSIAALEEDMEFQVDGGFYIRKTEKYTGVVIRYCPVCWKKDGKTVPLETSGTPGSFRCSIHNIVFRTVKGRKQWSRTISSRLRDPYPWGG